jgi:cytidyltransferase-like protein
MRFLLFLVLLSCSNINNKQYDMVLYAGRFQPFHHGHYRVVNEAKRHGKHILIVISQAKNGKIDSRNPFTGDQRYNAINDTLINDKVKNIAYVATCGHLWNQGVMNADEGKKRNIKCKVITWYHNDLKLDSPKSYESTVIFYSYINGQDTGLITFNPDWEPNYFRLGSKNYNYIAGQYAHSVGCDAGTEVAHYEIKMLGIEGADLVSEQNSPRPGRSGGGLMDDNGYYIGTCWGTQYRDGTGKGYFTPLSVIHKFWSKQAGYNFLLEHTTIL